MTVAKAEKAAKATGVSFRIGTLDGKGQMLTKGYVLGRITAEVENDVVGSSWIHNRVINQLKLNNKTPPAKPTVFYS